MGRPDFGAEERQGKKLVVIVLDRSGATAARRAPPTAPRKPPRRSAGRFAQLDGQGSVPGRATALTAGDRHEAGLAFSTPASTLQGAGSRCSSRPPPPASRSSAGTPVPKPGPDKDIPVGVHQRDDRSRRKSRTSAGFEAVVEGLAMAHDWRRDPVHGFYLRHRHRQDELQSKVAVEGYSKGCKVLESRRYADRRPL